MPDRCFVEADMIQEVLRAKLCYESSLGWMMSDKGEGFLEEANLSRGLKDREDLEWGKNKEKVLQAQIRARVKEQGWVAPVLFMLEMQRLAGVCT